MVEMKILKRAELVVIRKRLAEEGKSVGFTSGSFDLLHRGHIDYLQKAKRLCDVLIVGVNSDSSVREYKGTSRPIVREDDRAELVAALECVDYVFLFEEQNNNQNISLLQPGIYFKGGDYDKSRLSSASLIESYGGRVELIPFLEGYSTTSLIRKIEGAFLTSYETSPASERKPAVFVDRDGTICEHVEYLHEKDKFTLVPFAMEGLKAFQDAGYYIIVVTNQPGIGLGYFAKEDFFAVNRELLIAASKAKVAIDKIYFCPHSKSENCRCRKPETGMLQRAVSELLIDRERSVVIGDMTSDIELGHRFGCRTVLVQSGRGGDDKLFDVSPDVIATDILDAARKIKELDDRETSI